MEGWEGLQEAGCWPALEKVVYKNPAFPSQDPAKQEISTIPKARGLGREGWVFGIRKERGDCLVQLPHYPGKAAKLQKQKQQQN